MKIIKLESENIKRLRAVEITPDGALVRITGKNAAGKSSVLDSIVYVLGGERTVPLEPIRKGAQKARINISLGDIAEEFHAERVFTHKSSYLKVMAADGGKVTSPQALLDRLVGQLSFDPLAFAREDTKRQAEVLRELAGLDFTELDRKEARLVDDRREVGAEGRAAKARLDGMAPPKRGLPKEKIDIVEADKALGEAMAENRRIEAADRRLEELGDDVVNRKRRIRELEEALASAKKDLAHALAEEHEAQGERDELGKMEDVTTMARAISEAAAVNVAVDEAERYRKMKAEVEKLRKKHQLLERSLEATRDERRRLIARANYPLPGLGISDDGKVTYGGLPFSQASLAERLRVSTAVAMALNPKLRVVRITDGSLLDSTSMEILASMAAEYDFQVWIEQVDESGKVGFYIEDGSLAAVDGEVV